MVNKTTFLTSAFVAALAVGILAKLFGIREMMESGTYRAACWSDGDCGADGRCDDVLGCVPRGTQPKVDKMAHGKLLETFAQQSVGAPAVGETGGVYSGVDASGMYSSAPAATPLKSYEAADDNQLFEYQNTPMRPECCPAVISGDTGCVCLTPEQERKLATRGGNRATLK
jgi:hypothetical protein